MQLFEIKKTVEAIAVTDKKRIREVIEENPDKVYLIIDNSDRNIWLYSGKSSGIPEQIIGVNLQKEMKVQLRGFYHIENLNSLDKEDKNYKRIMSAKVKKDGRATEIKKESVPEEESELTDTQKEIKMGIEASRVRETCVHKGVQPKIAIVDLMNLETPEGYKQHMSIIGNGIYIKGTEIEKFLTENKRTQKMKRIGELPNGFFFLEDVSTRLVVKRGKVECIDLLKKKDEKLGVGKPLVPLFFKEKLHRDGDINILMQSFEEPEHKEEATPESAE
ncbi:MAG: hypothetical protein GF364_05790 [Candidatus Lokiarchaeota archaeon]|nr:hypothetical protein [Candidatus Lokiarchaeota archaeon]